MPKSQKQSPVELPTVATYPFAGERGEAHGCVFQRRKMHGVATNIYWKENVRKTKGNQSWRIFQIRELYLRLRKVLAPLTFVPKDNNLRLELCETMYLNFYFFFYFLRSTKARLLFLRALHRRGNQTYVVLSKGANQVILFTWKVAI